MTFKRGSVIDLLVIPVVLFAFGFYLYISYYTVDTVGASPMLNATVITAGKQALTNYGLTFPMLAIVWGATSVVLAWTFGGSPVTYVLSALATGFIMMVSAQLSDTFEVIQTYFPSTTINAMPFVGTINLNLPIYVLGWGVLVIIATHRGGGGTEI